MSTSRRIASIRAVDEAAPDIDLLVGRVLLGDAFDLFDRLPDESVDLIITSPPYRGHREYGLDHNWDVFNNIQHVRKVFADRSGGYAGTATRAACWVRSLTLNGTCST